MTPGAITGFVAASALLALVPGPGVAYILARTLAQGRAAGLASVAGVAVGNWGNALCTALGLVALLEVSRFAFAALSWAGALYLMALGGRMLWRALRAQPTAPVGLRPASRRRLARDGFVVALLNPKTTLFFGAFLPQFIDAARPALPQAVALGAGFVAIAACSDAAYVLVAERLGVAFGGRRPARARLVQAVAGAGLVALGLVGGLAGQRRGA